MKTKASPFVLGLLALIVLAAIPAWAGGGANGCSVEITHPHSGQDVGGSVAVEGTATIPPDHHLWVFARHKSFRTSNEWWAQGEASTESGRWQIDATIGESRDLGSDFDITAAVFDNSQILTLTSHFEANKKMKMPTAACVAKILFVHKTSE